MNATKSPLYLELIVCEWVARWVTVPLICLLGLLIVAAAAIPQVTADRGMYAAVGLVSPPTHDGRGPWMHPGIFLFGAVVCAALSRFCVGNTWDDMTGGQRKNVYFVIPTALTAIMVAFMVGCAVMRYRAWYHI